MLVDSSTVVCWTICHFRDVRSTLSLLFNFRWKILLANSVDPDQVQHDVASYLGLHCLSMTFYGLPDKNGLTVICLQFAEQSCLLAFKKSKTFLRYKKMPNTPKLI